MAEFLLLVLLVGSHLWVYWWVVRPLYRLAQQAEALSQGRLDALECPCGGISPIDRLRRSMAGMVGHLRRVQAEGHDLAEGRERERQRIAHELHDETVQSFIAIAQTIDLAQQWLRQDPDQVESMLMMAREQSVQSVASLRDMIAALRPPALDELGLVAALNMIADPVRVEGTTRRLDEGRELALFRAAQEGITNAVRHGNADHIQVVVRYQDDGIRLSVIDNGVGFQPPDDLSRLAEDRHFGLIGIQERIEKWHGSLRVESAVGAGTTLVVFVPYVVMHLPDGKVRDPVCSAELEPKAVYGETVYQGKTYYFCCPVCQGAFNSDPELYI